MPNKFILAVGNFDSRHNLEKVVEALPLLAQEDINLVVVGHKNDYFTHLMLLAENLGVKDRIVRIKEINPIAMPAVRSPGRGGSILPVRNPRRVAQIMESFSASKACPNCCTRA